MMDGHAFQPRRLTQVIDGLPASDGAGVKMTRLVGTPDAPEVGPFLMLDLFGSDDPDAYIAGFPDHPHRGFETVTIMLAGRMRHRDHLGNSGLLEPGHVQWMTAARGIVHSEMPEQTEGRMAGFQLWLNLPRKHKMDDPDWHDFTPGELTRFAPGPGIEAALIAGSLLGETGPVSRPITEPVVATFEMAAGTSLALDLPAEHAAMVAPWEGAVEIGGATVAKGQVGLLSDGDALTVTAGRDGVKLLLAAARPLNEPVVRYGPFVMATEGEIRQAIMDFRTGRF